MAEELEPGEAEQAYARRVAEAKATVPHAYLEVRAQPRDEAPPHAVVQAVADALRDAPRVNGAYRDGRYELRSEINVGVAVAAQGTLFHPVIRNADEKDASEIARELEELSERVRSEAVTQPELSGATFSLADLRAQGVARASGIVRRGQAAYLSVGEPAPGRISLSLACDARILHGPEAAEFLAAVRGSLEC